MCLAIIDVKPLENYKLLVTFENNEVREYDASNQLELGIFRQLKDIHLFNRVRVGFETIEWPNGADLDPELIYEESIRVS